MSTWYSLCFIQYFAMNLKVFIIKTFLKILRIYVHNPQIYWHRLLEIVQNQMPIFTHHIHILEVARLDNYLSYLCNIYQLNCLQVLSPHLIFLTTFV